ncbi:TetR/AcrR family transcriptional regulator [Cellulosimicrobium marinum]|uniref:TetR/AcrR family transcriptional regulator n=1 Tax=Cellulosimicrobium marinum TaxID=1638992 RepID=UPI001E599F72|nr:TetR family transcriptional regulator [Cellulosimicrobium marinum]MCB7135934.1 TetR/AcrR family transcriptional regulator [Cellulosimicrobium marinum]
MDDPARPAPEPESSPVLQRLWGQEAPRRRGPKPALSVDRIARAAVALADAEGLDAVSMARVAETLGYSSMALYRYVASKDELLSLMADAAAADLVLPETSGLGWRADLEAWTRAQVEGVVSRPWYIDLPLPAVRLGPHRVRWIDRAFAILRDLDLTTDEKLQVVGLLAQHVLAEARVVVETRRAAAAVVRLREGLPDDTPADALDPTALTQANPYYDFETVLRHFATPQEYPDLVAALTADPPAATVSHPAAQPADAGAPSTPDDWESDFGASLAIVLDGVEVFVARRLASRGQA